MTGKVWLVGAGPGDPGLLTVRAQEVLQAADVVVYDYLVEPALLDLAPLAAERIYMGKSGGHSGAAQRQLAIEALLVERGLAGRRVVRLKGGDPFVFGRGGEEAAALRAAGVAFEVVPGISSAIAVPAYAGIPVTHRDHNTALAIVTGHEDPTRSDARTNWPALAGFAASGGTLVILMGVKNLRRNMSFLASEGVSGDMPVCLVRWGTRPDQVVLAGSISDIADRVAAEGFGPPAVCVVGPTAGLADALAWFEPGPLRGARVWIPRPAERGRALAEALRAQGARPIVMPLIETDTIPSVPGWLALARASEGHYLAFTSAHAVEAFGTALLETGDARALHGFSIATVGRATDRALVRFGLRSDLTQEAGGGASLGTALSKRASKVTAFLAREPRPELGATLRAAGVDFEEVACYLTHRRPLTAGQRDLLARFGVDVVVLTAPSIASAYMAEVEADGRLAGRLVAIGATTAQAIRAHGAEVAAIAASPAVADLVDAVHQVMGDR